MDASKEIKRLRRDAADHEWHAKELTCRADALEARDTTYWAAREKAGIPREEWRFGNWLQSVVSRVKA